MNIVAYAAAKATAIDEIGENLEIDLSREALPKSSETKILELFRLQKIAKETRDMNRQTQPTQNEIMDAIAAAKGIGPGMSLKIEGILADFFADHPSTQG